MGKSKNEGEQRMNVYYKAIICVASSIGRLNRLEILLNDKFAKDYVVEVADSAIEVIDIISTLLDIGIETAVIITDMLVEDMSGLELIQMLHKKYPMIQMMLVTNEVNSDITEHAVNQENLFCLVKEDWKEEQMIQLITGACCQYQSKRELDNIIRQLRLSEHEKSLILSSISESIIYLNLKREIIWKNKVADKDLMLWKKSGACFKAVFGGEDDSDDCSIGEMLSSKKPFSIEKEFMDGTYKLIRFFPVLDQGNQVIGIVVTLLDITERVVSRNMNKSLLDMSRFINETESIMAMYGKAYESLCRYFSVRLMCVAGEDFDESYIEFISDTSEKLSREQVISMLKSLQNIIVKNKIDDVIMMENKLGTIIAYPMNDRILMVIVEDAIEKESVAIEFINIIAEQIKTGMSKMLNLKQITYQARHDSNTGLYNRVFFVNQLRAHLEHKRLAHSDTKNYSVALLDLNYFKDVNDNFSHIIGDHVLMEIANRLKLTIRGSDIVARVGGDEFAILFVNHDRSEVTRMIRRLQKNISSPIVLEECQIKIGSSVGIVYDISEYNHVNTLLRDADKAMYEAKKDRSGIGHYKFYEKAIQRKVELHMKIEHLLKDLDYDKDLRLLYQPIINLKDMSVKGYEGYIRWEASDGQHFMPNEFIPVANESEDIIGIGQSVIKMAIDAIKKMDQSGCSECFINVNLTSKQLLNEAHMAMVKKAIVGRGISSSRLRFDITDCFKANQIDAVAKKISEFRDFGVEVSLDDFGTGESSLVTLNKMNVNEIKIDASYIRRIKYDEDALRMVKSIISLAKSMGIQVLAEGVENKEELDILINLGCDKAQGYYFSKPVTFDKALEMRFKRAR